MKKRNSDIKGTPVILPDPLSPHWPIAGFKHLRPEHKILLPKVTLDQVEGVPLMSEFLFFICIIIVLCHSKIQTNKNLVKMHKQTK
jgi:hypothetical protein